MKRLNLVGKRFGRWLVLKDAGNDRWGGSIWLCRCDCGKEKIVLRTNLNSNSRSCGCLQKELLSERASKFIGKNNPNYGNGGKIRGKNNPNYGNGWRIKGKNNPNYGKGMAGEKNPNWKGGIASKNRLVRSSSKYNNWRTKVFERDNYICQICGKRGGNMEAHHVYSFSIYIDFRFELWNEVTLCKECHNSTKSKESEFVERFLSMTYGYKIAGG